MGVLCLRAARVLAPSLLPGTNPDSRGNPQPRGAGHGGAGLAGREQHERTPRARLAGPWLCQLSTCPGWQSCLTWICPAGSFSPASKPFPCILLAPRSPPTAPSSPHEGPARLLCPRCLAMGDPERGEDVPGTLPGRQRQFEAVALATGLTSG